MFTPSRRQLLCELYFHKRPHTLALADLNPFIEQGLVKVMYYAAAKRVEYAELTSLGNLWVRTWLRWKMLVPEQLEYSVRKCDHLNCFEPAMTQLTVTVKNKKAVDYYGCNEHAASWKKNVPADAVVDVIAI